MHIITQKGKYTMNYPYILVLHEKWGDAFFLMNEPKDVLKFALETLTSRFEAGYYHKPENVPDNFNEYFFDVHNMSIEDAEELAKNHGQHLRLGNRTIANEIESMRHAYVEAIDELVAYTKIVDAVKEKKDKVAWRILQERSSWGYQYEGFTIEHIENKKIDN